MKNYWLLLVLSLALGTTFAWTMNYIDYGHREAFFGEITMDGTVNADNVMEKLKEYHTDASAIAELQSDPTFDFGAMAPGTEGKHSFVVKNVGSQPLKLELGASTCKCTLGTLEDSELAPGDSTSIDLEWTVSSDKSVFSQSAELRTNDPSQPGIRLTVSGLVISEIEFDPKRITFGEVSSGETFEFSTKMYSYFDTEIELIEGKFGSEELTRLTNFEFEPFEISDEDGVHKRARQGFRITAKVEPGLRQGPMITTLIVSFSKQAAEKSGENTDQTDASETADDVVFFTSAECAGRVSGSLSILESSKLKSTDGGGYIWNLGRLKDSDPIEFKALVALKGSQRESTNLTIGEIYPSDRIQAEFDAPLGRGEMRLFPLKLTLKPGEETVDLLGKNKDDFGWVWIESDNPKVSRMKIAVKVLIEPRP